MGELSFSFSYRDPAPGLNSSASGETGETYIVLRIPGNMPSRCQKTNLISRVIKQSSSASSHASANNTDCGEFHLPIIFTETFPRMILDVSLLFRISHEKPQIIHSIIPARPLGGSGPLLRQPVLGGCRDNGGRWAMTLSSCVTPFPLSRRIVEPGQKHWNHAQAHFFPGLFILPFIRPKLIPTILCWHRLSIDSCYSKDTTNLYN